MTKTAENLADRAAETADSAIRATQRRVNGSLNRLSDRVGDAHDQAVPILNRFASEAEELARRSLAAVRDRRDLVRERALQASHHTVDSIRDEPIKAVLIAAAAGAALVFLGSLLSRPSRRL